MTHGAGHLISARNSEIVFQVNPSPFAATVTLSLSGKEEEGHIKLGRALSIFNLLVSCAELFEAALDCANPSFSGIKIHRLP